MLTCPNADRHVWREKHVWPPRYRGRVGEIEVRRSARRKRSIQVRREGNRTIALVPAHLPQAEADEVIARLVDRLERREKRNTVSDADLTERAAQLSMAHLDGRAIPASVRWVTNQNNRWGSCTISDKTIRLSDRLIGMPVWVVDYVLVHELAHLIEPNHSARFWSLVDSYPQTERAKGFLEGVLHRHA